MSNLGVANNNPGNLLAGSDPYTGQTGVYHSPNGLSYAVFGTPQAGQNALLEWLQNNVGTNDNTSLTNLSEVASYFLNGSFDPLTSTANNPHASDWLHTVEGATGLSATAPITPSMFPAIASGIEKAEGTYGAFGPVAGSTVAGGSPGILGPIADMITNAISGAGAVTAIVTGKPVQNQGQTITPGQAKTAISNAAGASGVSSTLASIGNAVGTLTAAKTWQTVAIVLVALVALAGGIYLLGRSPPVLLKGT